MRTILGLICVFVLLGCSSTEPTIMPPQQLLNDPQFSLQSIESKSDVFTLSARSKVTIDQQITRSTDNRITTNSLLNFIFSPVHQNLNYLTGATMTAEETFNSKDANCLSLSIMAYSMARYVGIEALFQQVYIPEYWAYENGFSLLTGHVNLRLTRTTSDNISLNRIVYDTVGDLIVDFNPASLRHKFRTKLITENEILAMYYNNKGARAMINKRYDLAYTYFTAAIDSAPNYSSSFGNLGVLYRINDQLNSAELAYNHALLLDAENNTAKGNLALLYDMTGREIEAGRIRASLEANRAKNPYYALAKGNEALHSEDYQQAVNLFKRSIKLDRTIHESHFGLASAYFHLGQLNKSLAQLESARKHAYFSSDKRRYQGKIASLNAQLLQ